MRWHYLIILVILLQLVACNGLRPARTPPWASQSNQYLLGGINQPDLSRASPSYALLVIKDVTCGYTSGDAYQVDVSWVTTVDTASFTRVEYEVIEAASAVEPLRMSEPVVAGEEGELVKSGSFMIDIAEDEIEGVDDRILVRLVVGTGGTEETTMSPIEAYRVETLCLEEGMQPVEEGDEQ